MLSKQALDAPSILFYLVAWVGWIRTLLWMLTHGRRMLLWALYQWKRVWAIVFLTALLQDPGYRIWERWIGRKMGPFPSISPALVIFLVVWDLRPWLAGQRV